MMQETSAHIISGKHAICLKCAFIDFAPLAIPVMGIISIVILTIALIVFSLNVFVF